jgi:transposase
MKPDRPVRSLPTDSGVGCTVVAPSMIPKKPGERIKINRCDAVTLVRLFSAAELPSVWVPDAVHEAVRHLVRARDTAAADVRKKRQQLLSFLLRHGRIYSGSKRWTRAPQATLARRMGVRASGPTDCLPRRCRRGYNASRRSYKPSYRVGRWRQWLPRHHEGDTAHRLISGDIRPEIGDVRPFRKSPPAKWLFLAWCRQSSFALTPA